MMEDSSIRHIKFQGKTIEVDEEGFLKSDKDWSEELANYLSKEDGIELSKDHWEIINFVRWYYVTYQNSPHPRFIIKKLNKRYESAKYTVKYLFELFRKYPVKRACKYAGIPFTEGT
ncbi:MAG TPA: TusE/DsrC/DsvC family sulfur relay protein [Thermodesulfovibrionales bacterium]|nr:TusE/DsrC/DsvC family sulfur relay protein [Thermodesulfovibrionales bacterium]